MANSYHQRTTRTRLLRPAVNSIYSMRVVRRGGDRRDAALVSPPIRRTVPGAEEEEILSHDLHSRILAAAPNVSSCGASLSLSFCSLCPSGGNWRMEGGVPFTWFPQPRSSSVGVVQQRLPHSLEV